MKKALIALLLLPAAAPCRADASSQPAGLEELKTEVRRILVENGIPGVGLVLASPGRVLWAGGAGKADLAQDRPVTAETLFRGGSIAKSFVALALVKLQEQGRIDLNARVRDLAPEIEIPNPWEDTHPVRVVHLLEHTAGFDDWRWAGNLTDEPAEIPLRDVLSRFPGRHRVRWMPGTRMVYSSHGYLLAGYLIEKASGERFHAYIRRAILDPLGFQHSGFERPEAGNAMLARGYSYRPLRPLPYRFLLQRPAGDFLISPADMGCFLRMWLNRGRTGRVQLFRPESLARVEQAQTSLAARRGLQWSYGLGNHPMDAPELRRRGHGGQIEGFLAFYVYLPEARLAYAVFMNTWSPRLGAIDRLIGEYLTSGSPRSQPVPESSATGQELRRLEGVYLPADVRVHAGTWPQLLQRATRVRAEGRGLHLAGLFGKGRQQLIPVFPGGFRSRGELEASTVFTRSDDARWVMTGSRGYFERVPAWMPYLGAGGLLPALLLMLSSVAYALVWIPARLLGRPVRHAAVRAVPLGAVLALIALTAGMLIAPDDPTAAVRFDLPSASYWLVSWLFLVLSFLGLLLARRAFAYELKPAVRIHALLVSIACCGMAAALAHWDLLALGPPGF